MTRINAAFWNLQNLFDTRASPIAADLEFTPAEGWTPERLEQKLDRLTEIIAGMYGGRGPDLLGLCEIETEELLARLTARVAQATGRDDLRIAHADSPDIRGIDCALLYSADLFELAAPATGHLVHFRYPTRDIFEVPLRLRGTGEELIVFVTHWPSRRSDGSAPFRIAVASHLGRLIDGYLKLGLAEMQGVTRLTDLHDEMKARWGRNVMVMGDLNDDPFDRSVMDELRGANSEDAIEEEIRVPPDDRDREVAGTGRVRRSDVARYLGEQANLYNLSWGPLGTPGEGSIHFAQESGRSKQMFDQILISRGLYYGLSGLRCDPASFELMTPRAMWTNGALAADAPRHLVRPRAFDKGTGRGYSDHFPVGAVIERVAAQA